MLEIEIHNRIPIGFAIGWSWFGIEENYDFNEIIIYLVIISVHFKWK